MAVEKIVVDKENGTTVLYQNKEMQSLYNPFKIIYNGDVISYLIFKDKDSIWAKNFKRAIASALQVQGEKPGAFVEKEVSSLLSNLTLYIYFPNPSSHLQSGIHGICSTEYYVTTKSNGHLSIRKTPELNTCDPYRGGIHAYRKNVPDMNCDEENSEKSVIVGNEAIYDLAPRPLITSNNTNSTHTIEYYLSEAQIEGNTLLQTFESTGESQFITSKLILKHLAENEIVNAIDVATNMSILPHHLDIEEYKGDDPTGERQPVDPIELIRQAIEVFTSLADSFEDLNLKFGEPYESRVAELIRIISRCDYKSLEALYKEIDIGTSYRQETIRNLFYDIIPRVGTKASVMLTRDLIVKHLCKPTTAVLLLIILPFHVADLSLDLINECEVLMSLSKKRVVFSTKCI